MDVTRECSWSSGFFWSELVQQHCTISAWQPRAGPAEQLSSERGACVAFSVPVPLPPTWQPWSQHCCFEVNWRSLKPKEPPVSRTGRGGRNQRVVWGGGVMWGHLAAEPGVAILVWLGEECPLSPWWLRWGCCIHRILVGHSLLGQGVDRRRWQQARDLCWEEQTQRTCWFGWTVWESFNTSSKDLVE